MTLAQKLPAFDRGLHGGEAMPSAPVGGEGKASVRPKRDGFMKGKIQVADSATFNAPDEEMIALFEGR